MGLGLGLAEGLPLDFLVKISSTPIQHETASVLYIYIQFNLNYPHF
jgi:hypothetical protein